MVLKQLLEQEFGRSKTQARKTILDLTTLASTSRYERDRRPAGANRRTARLG